MAHARRPAIETQHREESSGSGHARQKSAESFSNCIPIPGLVTRPGHRTAHERAPVTGLPERRARPIRRGSSVSSSVIRRSITVGSTAVATPADFLPLAKRKSWDAVELKVLQFMCDDTTQDYEFRKSKWREDLLGHMSDMPQAFYDRLTTVAHCNEVIDWYKSARVKDTTGRLQQRRSTLFAAEFRADFTPGFGLEVPTLPPGYQPSVTKKIAAVSASADRPPWQKMTNPFAGGGKETGIQNVHLSQQLLPKAYSSPIRGERGTTRSA